MKTLKYTLALAGLASLFLSSCDVNRLPKNSIPAEQSLLTLEGIESWGAGFMSGFRSKVGGSYILAQEYQADMLNAGFGTTNDMHLWSEDFNAANEVTNGIYYSYYVAISNINFVLGGTADRKEAKPEDQKRLDTVRGKGLFLRAYYYFNLAIRYGTPYKSTADDDALCVPLLLKYDPRNASPRATNKEVYDQILKDLSEARTLLKEVKNEPMSTEFNEDAITALEARVEFYKNDMKGAYDSAIALINTKRYPLNAPDPKAFEDMWLHDKSNEIILTLNIQRPDELSPGTSLYRQDISLSRDEEDGKVGANAPSFFPSQWVVDMYDAKDLRKNVYFESQYVNFLDTFTASDVYVVSKGKGNPAYSDTKDAIKYAQWGGYIPNGLHAPKVFRIAEAYLIAAEAASMLKDDTNALKYLNELKKSRGLSPLTLGGAELFKEIKTERAKELAFEGFRLWDLRRWGDDMKRHDPQVKEDPILGTDVMFLNPDDHNMKIEAGNPKFVWPIPFDDIKNTPALATQQNPGW